MKKINSTSHTNPVSLKRGPGAGNAGNIYDLTVVPATRIVSYPTSFDTAMLDAAIYETEIMDDNCMDDEVILNYVHKTMSENEYQQYTEHIQKCPACKQSVEDMEWFIETGGDLDELNERALALESKLFGEESNPYDLVESANINTSEHTSSLSLLYSVSSKILTPTFNPAQGHFSNLMCITDSLQNFRIYIEIMHEIPPTPLARPRVQHEPYLHIAWYEPLQKYSNQKSTFEQSWVRLAEAYPDIFKLQESKLVSVYIHQKKRPKNAPSALSRSIDKLCTSKARSLQSLLNNMAHCIQSENGDTVFEWSVSNDLRKY